jgi:plasmid stabilization system protein ParE
MRVCVLHPVEEELIETARWYEERRAGLGEEFIDEYHDAVVRVLAAPHRFARLETARSRRDIRRCFLKRFPHYIAYEIKDDEIIVLAVAHARRRPNYFLRRQ